MDTMTPDQAIAWLMNNDNSLGGSMNNIMTSQRALAELPAGSPARRAHQQILDDQLSQVTKARNDQAMEEAGYDPNFANPACDCVPGEPCCLRAYHIEDKKDPTRKVNWPIADGKPGTLFMIAKDPYNGSPSAEVKVTLTDYEGCKSGKDLPGMLQKGFVDVPPRFKPDATQSLISTVPFHIPALLSAFFPEEVLYAIYVIGYYTSAASYAEGDHLDLDPNMCNAVGLRGLRVKTLPHLSLIGEIEGKVGVTFFFSQIPTVFNGLSGTVTGEFGYQKLEYKSERQMQTSNRKERAPGPPAKSPVLDTLLMIFEKMDLLSKKGGESMTAPQGLALATRPSITVEKSLKLSLMTLKLKGKTGSPDLELVLNPMALRGALTVTGKVDFLGMLIDRVPGIASALHDARERLADEDNPVSVELICALELSATGGLEFGVDNFANITIGNAPGWEADFDRLQTRWQADAKITGELKAKARVGIDTWLFDGSAGAQGTVSTGWHFGGRTLVGEGGKKTRQTLYHFEGLILKGSYYVEFGGSARNNSSKTFETFNDRTEGKREHKRTRTNSSRVVEREFDAEFMEKEGKPDDWKTTG